MESFFTTADYNSLLSIYVSKEGNDESGDGSISNPYLSIGAAIINKASSGVIIRVKSGIYNENFNLSLFASKEYPLVLYSEDGPGNAIIDGENNRTDLIIVNGQNIVIDGFEIKNCNGFGIGIFPRSGVESRVQNSYCVIRNNIIHNTGRDAIKSAHINFLLIENNDISEVRHLNQFDDCIDGVAVYHTICRFNYLHDNGPGSGGYFNL